MNVKIVATHGGISVGEDGATHQAIEDIAIMRALPNMRVIVAADPGEVKAAVFEAIRTPGPVYVRLGRSVGGYVHPNPDARGAKAGPGGDAAGRHGRDTGRCRRDGGAEPHRGGKAAGEGHLRPGHQPADGKAHRCGHAGKGGKGDGLLS